MSNANQGPVTIALDHPLALKIFARNLVPNDTNKMELNPFLQFCGQAGNPNMDYPKWGGIAISNSAEHRKYKRLRITMTGAVDADNVGMDRYLKTQTASLAMSSGRVRSVEGIKIDAPFQEARLSVPTWMSLNDDLMEAVASSQFGFIGAHAFGRVGSEPGAFAQDFEAGGAFSGMGDFEPNGTTDAQALNGHFIKRMVNRIGIDGAKNKVVQHPMVWGAWDLPGPGVDPRGNPERGIAAHVSDPADASDDVNSMLTFDSWIDINDALAKMRNAAGRGGVSFNPMMMPGGVKDAEGHEVNGEGYVLLTHREVISSQLKADPKWEKVQEALLQGGKDSGLLTGYLGKQFGRTMIVGYDKVPIYKNDAGVRIARGVLMGKNGMTLLFTNSRIPKRYAPEMNRSMMAISEALLPAKMRHWADASQDTCAIGWEWYGGFTMHDWKDERFPNSPLREGTVAIDSVIPSSDGLGN